MGRCLKSGEDQLERVSICYSGYCVVWTAKQNAANATRTCDTHQSLRLRLKRVREVVDGVLKNCQALALLTSFHSRPARMMRVINIAFRVWHESEDTSRGVAHSSHVALRTVGVEWKWHNLGAGCR